MRVVYSKTLRILSQAVLLLAVSSDSVRSEDTKPVENSEESITVTAKPVEDPVESVTITAGTLTDRPMQFCEIAPDIPDDPADVVALFREILMTDAYAKIYADSQKHHDDDSGFLCRLSWPEQQNVAARHAAKVNSVEMTDLLAEFYGLPESARSIDSDQLEITQVLLKQTRCQRIEDEDPSNWNHCFLTINQLDERSADVDVSEPHHGKSNYQFEKRNGTTRSYWILVRERITAIY